MSSIPALSQDSASRRTIVHRTFRTLRRAAAALLLAGVSGAVDAQSFSEGFNDITTLTANGWSMTNASVAVGSTGWFQGSPAASGEFDAYNGAAHAYIAADFNNTGNVGTISNWLITPNRTVRNGDILTFRTRKHAPDHYPDRLEVRLSTNGASTNVGSGAGVGDFSRLLLSVNPNLTLGAYPTTWTPDTVTVSGLPAPTSSRLAFRYFVTDGGQHGDNAEYIGIDQVDYTPYVCPAFTMTPSGDLPDGAFGRAYSFALTQTGAQGAPNFAVTSGALPPGLTLASNGTISGTPSGVARYDFTVTVTDNSGCSSSQAYAITVAPMEPDAPRNVVAVAGDAQVTVSFLPRTSDGGQPITEYIAICDDGISPNGADAATSPIVVNFLTNGSAYTCTVVASNVNGWSLPSDPSNSVVPMGEQTITFGAQAGQAYSPGGSFAIDPLAVASSGLDVEYASATPAVCSIAGTTVSILAAGTCTITADQPGNGAWNPAPRASRSIAIAQAPQTLTFPGQVEPSRGFEQGATFAIDPQATSAEPNSGQPIVYSSLDTGVCTVAGTTVTMVSEGTCTIAANQDGDVNYADAAQVDVDVAIAGPIAADLWVEKTAHVDRSRIGDTVAYTIVVGNDGPSDAANVDVMDIAPERLAAVLWECTGATNTDCPDPDADDGDLAVVIAALPANATVTFELLGTVVPAADPADDYTAFGNTASVALPQGSSLADPAGNNESTATVQVIPDAIHEDGFEATPE